MEKQPPGATLNWRREIDDNDNTAWELNSPFTDDGDPLVYRLRQIVQEDAIWWADKSDAELTDGDYTWSTLEAAVRDMEEAWHNCQSVCIED